MQFRANSVVVTIAVATVMRNSAKKYPSPIYSGDQGVKQSKKEHTATAMQRARV